MGLVQRACARDGHWLHVGPPEPPDCDWWECVVTLGPNLVEGGEVAVGKGSTFSDALRAVLDDHAAVSSDG